MTLERLALFNESEDLSGAKASTRRREHLIQGLGFQFNTTVMGGDVDRVSTLITNRPSGATSYCWRKPA